MFQRRTNFQMLLNKDGDELIVLIQTIAWKRELKFLEVNQNPIIMREEDSLNDKGSLEMTEVGQKLENTFDPQSLLTKGQVKELYLDLEKFVETVSGDIEIIKNGYSRGSVMEITIPI